MHASIHCSCFMLQQPLWGEIWEGGRGENLTWWDLAFYGGRGGGLNSPSETMYRLSSFCRLAKSFWYCRPTDTVSKIESLWDLWSFISNDWFKSYQSQSVCIYKWMWIWSCFYKLWCPSGICSRAPSIFIIYKWP